MYEYIKGLLVEATPAYAVIECGGVGYYINISVNTYSQIVALQQVSFIFIRLSGKMHSCYTAFSIKRKERFSGS